MRIKHAAPDAIAKRPTKVDLVTKQRGYGARRKLTRAAVRGLLVAVRARNNASENRGVGSEANLGPSGHSNHRVPSRTPY